ARALDGLPEASPHVAAARVAVLLGAERDREALRRARALLDAPGHTLRTRAHVQTLGAVAALREGEPEQAWAWLNDAALAWERYGPRLHVALLAPRDRRRLFDFAVERGSASLQRYLDVPLSDARSSFATASLTPRERVVLAELAVHDSIREIAGVLVVSPHTVKTQLQGLYRKLGVTSRASALAVARELGLLDAPRADA
ncbi:MAG: LuxR C-terminal-related transcriptional regulator, partial [Microbacterium sp.]